MVGFGQRRNHGLGSSSPIKSWNVPKVQTRSRGNLSPAVFSPHRVVSGKVPVAVVDPMPANEQPKKHFLNSDFMKKLKMANKNQ